MEELLLKAGPPTLTAANVKQSWFQITDRFFRLKRLDNLFGIVFLFGVALGLGLNEETVRQWIWVPDFIRLMSSFVPIVDAFWRVSPFPTVAQLIPASVWALALCLGPVAVLTVRHLDFPAMRMSVRPAVEMTTISFLIVILFAVGGGDLTPERVEGGRRIVRQFAVVARHQWLFGVAAGVIGGLVAWIWGAICVVTFRRTLGLVAQRR